MSELDRNSGDMNKQIKSLSVSALALAKDGNLADAQKIYESILKIAPYHRSSLSFMATQAFSSGNLNESLGYLDKAIQGSSDSPLLFQNRALVYKALGNFDAAMRDLDRAIELQPDVHSAKLHKALILKEIGDFNNAIKLAVEGLRAVPNLLAGEINPGDNLLPGFLADAMQMISAAQLMTTEAELQPVIDEFGAGNLERVLAGLEKFSVSNPINSGHISSEATVLNVSGLSAAPAFDHARGSWAEELKIDLEVLLKESFLLLERWNALFRAKTGRVLPVAENEGLPFRYILNLTSDEKLIVPNIASLVDNPQLGGAVVSDDSAVLVIAPPGRHILSHEFRGNWLVTACVVLDSSEPLRFYVGDETKEVSAGEVIVLNSKLKHEFEVVNNGSNCLFLTLEMWHPELTLAEIAGLSAICQSFRRFHSKYL